MLRSKPGISRIPALTAGLLAALLAPSLARGQCQAELVQVQPGPFELNWGRAMAASGDTVVIGADGYQGSSGAAFVYERDAGGPDNWGLAALLTPNDPTLGDRFGQCVAIEGDTIVVGAPENEDLGYHTGSAYVFERDLGGPGAWGQVTKLLGSNSNGSDEFGRAVAVEGDTIFVGAPGKELLNTTVGTSDFGLLYHFERDFGGSGTWGEVAFMERPAGGDRFGELLSLEGDTLLVGTTNPLQYVYTRGPGSPATWLNQASVASFASSAAISGDTLAIGNAFDQSVGPNSGGAYVHERDAGGPSSWGQVKQLFAPQPFSGDQFGNAIGLGGDAVLVGTHQDDEAELNAGAAYLFVRDSGGAGNFGFVEKLLGPVQAGARFGSSVAVEGDLAFVATSPNSATKPRELYVYRLRVEAPASYCTAGTTASGCRATVSASGTPSASAASGFDVSVAGSEGQKDGVIYFGTSGAQAAPWGNGSSFQCVVPPVVRTGTQAGTGSPGACDGSFALDFNAWMAANPGKAPGSGSTVHLQAWFRDPGNTSNQSTSLSDALRFSVCP